MKLIEKRTYEVKKSRVRDILNNKRSYGNAEFRVNVDDRSRKFDREWLSKLPPGEKLFVLTDKLEEIEVEE